MKRSNAFTLTEILVAIGLIVFFTNLSTQLFRETMDSMYAARQYQNQSARIDSAVAKLGQDVWNATSITTPDDKTAQLTEAEGRTVAWTVRPDGTLVRTSGPSDLYYQVPGSDWHFKADAESLWIIAAEHGQTKSLRLASQMMIAEKETP